MKYHISIFDLAREHATILTIALLVLAGNAMTWQRVYAERALANPLFDVKQEDLVHFVSQIDQFTPVLKEDPNQVASLLVGEENDLVQRPALGGLDVSTPGPTPVISYTVQKGDSLAKIAQQFGLHVATILEANNIKAQDASKLTVGTALIIPAEDTSASLAWLDAEQQAKLVAQKQAALAQPKKSSKNLLARAAGRVSTKEQVAGGFDSSASGLFIVPITSKGISRGLGRGHTGIDYRADVGTPVYAAADGRVIEKTGGWGGGWGLSLLLDNGGGWTSRYAHLSQFVADLGDTVSQGQLIGYSGNTGHSTGPHLHFETRINGRPVWPPYQ